MPLKWQKILATFFFIGDIPITPGSMGSLAGAFICVLLQDSLFLYILAFFLVTIVGFMVSGYTEELLQKKDPSCVVIDEVAGCFIAFFMLPMDFRIFIVTFFLFRAFDMFKIYPANQLQELKGSVGIMSDDLLAGLYTNIIMQIAIRWMEII